jgi:hypothetical protein
MARAASILPFAAMPAVPIASVPWVAPHRLPAREQPAAPPLRAPRGQLACSDRRAADRLPF